MHPNVAMLTVAAEAAGLAIEVREFPDGTRTADDAARAIGVEVGQIVKSLVFAVGDEVVVALVSGANQLDEALLGAEAAPPGGPVVAASRVDANRAREATGFPIGGVPPFAHATPLRVFVDEDLLAYEEVWAAGGTPRHVFGAPPAELVRITGGRVATLRRA